MKTIQKNKWLCHEPWSAFQTEEKIVKEIIQTVKEKGDSALKDYTYRFDRVTIENFRVSEKEIEKAKREVSSDFINTIQKAKQRIEKFCLKQKEKFTDWTDEEEGIKVGEIFRPLRKIGIYVPSGKAPLISTLLMASIPAKVAGVEGIILTTPPQDDGRVHPYILSTANLLNLEEIYKVGGAQAIAALAFGTETIPMVDKIVGPGNIYVTLAKKELYGEVGIDLLAGPSEVLVIADQTANPEFVAYDLLSQLEHGPHSLAILLSVSKDICEATKRKIKAILKTCDRETQKVWQENEGIYLVDNLEEAFSTANNLAPEHLVLAIKNPQKWMHKVRTAGAVFLGNYSPPTLGDYIAGPNHILPTSQTGKWASSLSVGDFLKCINVISANESSLGKFESSLRTLTNAEGFKNHLKAVEVRRKKVKTQVNNTIVK